MFRDSQTALYESAALTATGVSTNAYDLGAPFANGTASGAAIDPSVGHGLCVVIAVNVAATAGGTQTYEFDLIQSANANLSSADTLVQVPFTTARALALLTAGAIIVVPIPALSVSKRYLGLNFVGANTPTITVTAWITSTAMVQAQHYYTSAIVVN